MRIAILFSELSGYTLASWRALIEEHDVELLVYHFAVSPAAPFEFGDLNWIHHRHLRAEASESEILQRVREFRPQGVYVCGWMDRGYLRVTRHLKDDGIPIVAGLDAQWKGTMRQWGGVLISPWFLHPSIDILWAAGDRQVEFARRLGFTGPDCWNGYYTCDWDRFARPTASPFPPSEPAFVFVGRYIERKGLGCLLKAYRNYRQQAQNPWKLICAGAGPLQEAVEQEPGVENVGFVQPADLPRLFHERATVFVLPSVKEPWGVVVHEAATSGLPLICSQACGSGDQFIRPGQNGWVFQTNDTTDLCQKLLEVSSLPPATLKEFAETSHTLSQTSTPSIWANKFVEGIKSRRNHS